MGPVSICLCVCVPGDSGVFGAVSDVVRYLRLVHEELHLLQGQQPHMEGQGSIKSAPRGREGLNGLSIVLVQWPSLILVTVLMVKF